jgi:pimeloyl-ACP methyl ester carboxylesterase
LGVSAEAVAPAAPYLRVMHTDANLDAELEAAQAALLTRYAPDTRARRVVWSEGETQVLELGAGPPLLLIHGGLGSALNWVPILSALARNHRVLAVDRPGHGLADPFDYSDVDLLGHARTFLRDIVDALDLSAVDMVANSIGGLWSVVFALDAPDRVSRLALVGCPAGYKRQGPRQIRMLGLPFIGQPLGRRIMSRPTRDGSRTFWGQILVAHPERLDDALLDAGVAHQRRNIASMLSLVHCLLDARGLRRRLILGAGWQALTAPTVLLWGERDAFGTPEEGEALAARNPNLELVRIPDAGHLPWLDAPERVVDEIERFLAPSTELEAAPAAPSRS